MSISPDRRKDKLSDPDKLVPCPLCGEPATLAGHVGAKPRYRCSECDLWFDRVFDSHAADAGRKGAGSE